MKDKFVILINKERKYLSLYANFSGLTHVFYTQDDLFHDDVLKFDSLDKARDFIFGHEDQISVELANLDKLELYPAKVVPMYNIHKSIKIK